jgi:hypothetical protein
MKKKVKWVALLGSVFLGKCAPALGGVEFSIPDSLLLLDTANQTVPIYLTNDGDPFQIEGINLEIQVADGGPEAGGSIYGPSIQSASVIQTGALFASNNDGPIGAGSIVPQIFEIGTLIKSGPTQTFVIVPQGKTLVGEVQFSTVGLLGGGNRWDFSFSSSNGVTELFNVFGNDVSQDMFVSLKLGKLALVPEVEAYSLVAGGVLVGVGLLVRKYGRRG